METVTIRETIEVRDDVTERDIALACEELLGDQGALHSLPLLESCRLFVALKEHIANETGYDADCFLNKMARLVN